MARFTYRGRSDHSIPLPREANTLFYGDNLDVMRQRIRDESVDLCYIDPPFNSKRNYNQIYNDKDRAQAQAFIDTWTWDTNAVEGFHEIIEGGSGRLPRQAVELIHGFHRALGEGSLLAYLVGMTLRIAEIHRILKPTGSFYLHCDPTASHYLKIILDAIFDPRFFVNEVVWKRYGAHNDVGQGSRHYGRTHDIILFYTKSAQPTWNQVFTPLDPDYIAKTYRLVEPETGRRFTTTPMTGPGGAEKGNPVFEWNGHTRAWRYSKETMERLEREGRLYYSKTGYVRQKLYLEESKGVPVQDVWSDIPSLSGAHAERLGYPTQKPLALMERIIQASSNQGDVVFDPFAGCGTTVAAAQKLNRKWIGIDITYQSIAVVLTRLEDQFGKEVVSRINLDGIPTDMESAVALANKKDDRLRKEFEKWAVLTYSDNRAAINEKKGADGGIDGIAYFHTSRTDTATMIFQVKSGKVDRSDIATLRGDMDRVGAAMATLITLQEPTQHMIATAKAAGLYAHELMGRNYDRIQIVTVREMIEQKRRVNLPMSLEALKGAKAVERGEQPPLFDAERLRTVRQSR